MPSRLIGTLVGPTENTSLFDLAPRGVYLATHVTTRAGELLPHRFTHHPDKRGWFIFCCTCRRWTRIQRPDVIRLAALRCSDFPLLPRQKRLPGPLHCTASTIIAKNV